MQQRLQKVMANLGIASRRACERIIEEGRVQVNGQTAELGMKVSAADRITLDGKVLENESSDTVSRVLIYNKPEGEGSSRADPEQRRSVFAALPKLNKGRWISVGRLDITTTGLLLFTNDGELANRLMHPSYEIERKYAVRVLGEVTVAMQKCLLSGVRLDDGVARFLSLQDAGGSGANHWYHVTLAEGKNREVRRLWESQGLQVSRLIRIAYAGIELPRNLKTGAYIELTSQQLAGLYKKVGLVVKVEKKNKPRRTRSARRRKKIKIRKLVDFKFRSNRNIGIFEYQDYLDQSRN